MSDEAHTKLNELIAHIADNGVKEASDFYQFPKGALTRTISVLRDLGFDIEEPTASAAGARTKVDVNLAAEMIRNRCDWKDVATHFGVKVPSLRIAIKKAGVNLAPPTPAEIAERLKQTA
jgi:hypothetical protein